MANIIQTLVVATTLITITAAASNQTLAGGNSFYPSHFKHSNQASPWVGTESAIPVPYRVGD